MKELTLAKQLIKEAEGFYKIDKSAGRPSMIIDKENYKEYNFETLKLELEKLNYTLSELANAPEPLNLHANFLKGKLIAYKK